MHPSPKPARRCDPSLTLSLPTVARSSPRDPARRSGERSAKMPPGTLCSTAQGGSMDGAYISALSALAGSVVGGLTSGMRTWVSYRAQARTARLSSDLSRREDLFRDFIVAASKLYDAALMSSEPKIEE